MFKLLLAGLLLSSSTGNTAEEAAVPQIYIVPTDAECSYNKTNRTMSCTDKDGAPITGEVRQYQENTLVRQYPVVEGLVEGLAVAHYTTGELMTEKPYTAGKLNGEIKSYDERGRLQKITPYVDGKKEGVEKEYHEDGYLQVQAIIVNGKYNGAAKMYDKDGNTLLDLTYANNKIARGSCYYKANDAKGEIVSRNLSGKEISSFNKGELAPSETLGTGDCAFE